MGRIRQTLGRKLWNIFVTNYNGSTTDWSALYPEERAAWEATALALDGQGWNPN